MKNKRKIFKKEIQLPDKYLTEIEAEELEEQYINIAKNYYSDLQELEPSDFKQLKKEFLAGAKEAERKIKQHSFALCLDKLLNIFLNKDIHFPSPLLKHFGKEAALGFW